MSGFAWFLTFIAHFQIAKCWSYSVLSCKSSYFWILILHWIDLITIIVLMGRFFNFDFLIFDFWFGFGFGFGDSDRFFLCNFALQLIFLFLDGIRFVYLLFLFWFWHVMWVWICICLVFKLPSWFLSFKCCIPTRQSLAANKKRSSEWCGVSFIWPEMSLWFMWPEMSLFGCVMVIVGSQTNQNWSRNDTVVF